MRQDFFFSGNITRTWQPCTQTNFGTSRCSSLSLKQPSPFAHQSATFRLAIPTTPYRRETHTQPRSLRDASKQSTCHKIYSCNPGDRYVKITSQRHPAPCQPRHHPPKHMPWRQHPPPLSHYHQQHRQPPQPSPPPSSNPPPTSHSPPQPSYNTTPSPPPPQTTTPA